MRSRELEMPNSKQQQQDDALVVLAVVCMGV